MVVVDPLRAEPLPGVRDSKLLSPAERERAGAADPRLGGASGVGHASAAEIDALGIMAALRMAGNRAWVDILGAGITPRRGAAGRQPELASPAAQPALFDG